MLAVITEVAHGLTTVRVKLEGVANVGEVPYVIPFTITDCT